MKPWNYKEPPVTGLSFQFSQVGYRELPMEGAGKLNEKEDMYKEKQTKEAYNRKDNRMKKTAADILLKNLSERRDHSHPLEDWSQQDFKAQDAWRRPLAS